jgi:hypothetical protein
MVVEVNLFYNVQQNVFFCEFVNEDVKMVIKILLHFATFFLLMIGNYGPRLKVLL